MKLQIWYFVSCLEGFFLTSLLTYCDNSVLANVHLCHPLTNKYAAGKFYFPDKVKVKSPVPAPSFSSEYIFEKEKKRMKKMLEGDAKRHTALMKREQKAKLVRRYNKQLSFSATVTLDLVATRILI